MEELKHKLFSGEMLDKNEIMNCMECFHKVDEIEGKNRRWSRTMKTVIEVDGRYFMIVWEEGLTECQEDEYMEQPYEVKKHVETKTIEVVNWSMGENINIEMVAKGLSVESTGEYESIVTIVIDEKDLYNFLRKVNKDDKVVSYLDINSADDSNQSDKIENTIIRIRARHISVFLDKRHRMVAKMDINTNWWWIEKTNKKLLINYLMQKGFNYLNK